MRRSVCNAGASNGGRSLCIQISRERSYPCQYIDTNILLSVIELLFLCLSFEALQDKMCQNSLPSGGGRSLGAKISGGRGRSPANILIPLKRQLIALQLCADSFSIMKLCSRLLVPYCRNCRTDEKFRYFIPI